MTAVVLSFRPRTHAPAQPEAPRGWQTQAEAAAAAQVGWWRRHGYSVQDALAALRMPCPNAGAGWDDVHDACAAWWGRLRR